MPGSPKGMRSASGEAFPGRRLRRRLRSGGVPGIRPRSGGSGAASGTDAPGTDALGDRRSKPHLPMDFRYEAWKSAMNSFASPASMKEDWSLNFSM